MEVQVLHKALISVALVGILGLLFRLYKALISNPEKLRSALRKQGISGPPPTHLLGNLLEIKKARTAKAPPTCGAPTLHNCANALFPFFEHWQNKYGKFEQMYHCMHLISDFFLKFLVSVALCSPDTSC